MARNGESGPTQQNFNDFEPQIVGPISEWQEFVFNNFHLSAKIRTETVETFWIAILVNEFGMVDRIEWANPLGGNPKIAAQFIRVIKLWGNNFHPALDSFGNPVSKWLLIPFRIDRTMKGTSKPIRVYNDFI